MARAVGTAFWVGRSYRCVVERARTCGRCTATRAQGGCCAAAVDEPGVVLAKGWLSPFINVTIQFQPDRLSLGSSFGSPLAEISGKLPVVTDLSKQSAHTDSSSRSSTTKQR